MLAEAKLKWKRVLRAPYVVEQMRTFWRGFSTWRYGGEWKNPGEAQQDNGSNRLREFFNARQNGPGIWKWDHYFDIYDRHFSRFRNQEVNVLEVGIYSGGSLEMWRDYFGPRCQIFGVDIQPACRAYEREGVKVFVGDQSDRDFWRRFREEVPKVDIVIDDGSHIAEHQIVTFEELLPHLQSGGVYLCEDICGVLQSFASYAYGFAHNLNACAETAYNVDIRRAEVRQPTALQKSVASMHFYPYVTVVERTAAPISEFVSLKHGSRWEPFLG